VAPTACYFRFNTEVGTTPEWGHSYGIYDMQSLASGTPPPCRLPHRELHRGEREVVCSKVAHDNQTTLTEGVADTRIL
jgi:hypothetical protein